MRKLVLGVLGIAISLWLASSASAALTENVITLDLGTPLGFTAGTASGQIQGIDPILANNGLSALDSICLTGTCDIENQDWIVFEVKVTGGSVDGVGLGLLSQSALGMGYFLQGGPIQDGTGLSDTYTGSLGVPTVPQFTFLGNGGGAGLTGTSLALFVAYDNNTLPQTPPIPFNVFGDGAVQFMVTEWGGANVTPNLLTNFTTSAEVIPEPGTALLLGMGVLMLGARARNRRS